MDYFILHTHYHYSSSIFKPFHFINSHKNKFIRVYNIIIVGDSISGDTISICAPPEEESLIVSAAIASVIVDLVIPLMTVVLSTLLKSGHIYF